MRSLQLVMATWMLLVFPLFAQKLDTCEDKLLAPVWDTVVEDRKDLRDFRPWLTHQFKVWAFEKINGQNVYVGGTQLSRHQLVVNLFGHHEEGEVRLPQIFLKIRLLPVRRASNDEETQARQKEAMDDLQDSVDRMLHKTMIATHTWDFYFRVFLSENVLEMILEPKPETLSFLEYLLEELQKNS